MKTKAYSIFDSKVGSYCSPFFLRSKGEAIRVFTDLANDSKQNISKYPEDFVLFEIGDYDEETGLMIPYKSVMSVGCALEFKSKQESATLAAI